MRARTLLTLIIFGLIGWLVLSNFKRSQITNFLTSLRSSSPTITTEQNTTILSEENAVISVVDKVSSSVVAIGATKKVVSFDPFALPRNQSATIGTGFVVSEKGIIVTNKHVVSDDSLKYNVITKDDKKFEIKKIYRDPILDLAIVETDPMNVTPLTLGDSSKLKVGQTVIAIGNALGRFTNTVTTGVVSGVGRRVVTDDPYSGATESLDNLIQTDAAINPGNSGGPLLNSSGQVIGVNVATTEGAQNIGFAIPINSVNKIVTEFVTKGTVSRPFLGIKYRYLTKEVGMLYELPQGAYIQDVISGSSADKAGVKTGDVITKIDGQAVDSEAKISEIVSSKSINDKIGLTVWADNKENQLIATLQELPNQ